MHTLNGLQNHIPVLLIVGNIQPVLRLSGLVTSLDLPTGLWMELSPCQLIYTQVYTEIRKELTYEHLTVL